MAKYRDITGMGKSAVIPRRKYEPATERHERRLRDGFDKSTELQFLEKVL